MRFSSVLAAAFGLGGLASSAVLPPKAIFDKRSVDAGDGHGTLGTGREPGLADIALDQPEKRAHLGVKTALQNPPAGAPTQGRQKQAPAQEKQQKKKPPLPSTSQTGGKVPAALKPKTCNAAKANPKTKGGCLCRKFKKSKTKSRIARRSSRELAPRSDNDEQSSNDEYFSPHQVAMGKRLSVSSNKRAAVVGVNGCTSVFFFGPKGRTAGHLRASDDGSMEAAKLDEIAAEAESLGNDQAVTVDSPHTEASAAGARIKAAILAQVPNARITWRLYQMLPEESGWYEFTVARGSTTVVKRVKY